jgi:hypothetical protein
VEAADECVKREDCVEERGTDSAEEAQKKSRPSRIVLLDRADKVEIVDVVRVTRTLVAGSRESQFDNAIRHFVRWEADDARVAAVFSRLEKTALGAAGFFSKLGFVALGVCGHESLLVALVLLRSFIRLMVVAGTVHSSRFRQRTSLARLETRLQQLVLLLSRLLAH